MLAHQSRPRSRKAERKDRYELEKAVGNGGMGTVYRAYDRVLSRVVAVKVLRPENASDFRYLLRLKREVVLASQVSDKHVVRVHDIGEVGGRPLIAMDWVDGENLGQVLARVHRLPPTQVMCFAKQICQGLLAIHAARIVHRDLKPGNILIRPDGAVLVSDFGLARSDAPQDCPITEPGGFFGTPSFMAPEQFAGLPADSRSDLYSFGMILLQMVTGTLALEALSPFRVGLLTSTSLESSRRSDEVADLARLDFVIRRCLHPDRTERYPNARGVLDDLETPDRERMTTGAPKLSKKRITWRRLWKIAVFIGFLMVLAGSVMIPYRAAMKIAEAERLYARAVKVIDPESDAPELESGLRDLDKALADNPNHVPATRTRLETLIRLYEHTNRVEWLVRARDALEELSTTRLPREERTLFRARIDLDAGFYQVVISTLRDNPNVRQSEHTYRLLGGAFAGLRQMEPAVECYRLALKQNSESWETHNDLGYALLRLGDVHGARLEFLKVTDSRPDLAEGFLGIGIAALDSGKMDDARQNFEAALERTASSEVYYELGVTAFYERHYATAIPFFEAALRMHPDSDRYLIGLADALRRLQRHELADGTYMRAIASIESKAVWKRNSDEQSRYALCFARLGDIQTAKAILDALPSETKEPELEVARAIVGLIEGHRAASGRHLASAVRIGLPHAVADMNPDFEDIP